MVVRNPSRFCDRSCVFEYSCLVCRMRACLLQPTGLRKYLCLLTSQCGVGVRYTEIHIDRIVYLASSLRTGIYYMLHVHSIVLPRGILEYIHSLRAQELCVIWNRWYHEFIYRSQGVPTLITQHRLIGVKVQIRSYRRISRWPIGWRVTRASIVVHSSLNVQQCRNHLPQIYSRLSWQRCVILNRSEHAVEILIM